MSSAPHSDPQHHDRQNPVCHEQPCARLVQLSDPHLLADTKASHRSVNTTSTLAHVIFDTRSFIQKADAVLLTGDIAQDEAAETYSKLFDSWTQEWVGQQPAVWCLPGNHDAPVLMQSTLNTAPFSFLKHHQLGNWEVVILDSRNPGKASGLLGTHELERLAQRFKDSAAEHFLLVMHHHPVPLGCSWLDSVGLEDKGLFQPLIENEKRVRAVVFGHIHHPVDRTENHIRYLGCPSTCVQFTPQKTDYALDARPPGARALTLYHSGAIATEVLWVKAPNHHTTPAHDLSSESVL